MGVLGKRWSSAKDGSAGVPTNSFLIKTSKKSNATLESCGPSIRPGPAFIPAAQGAPRREGENKRRELREDRGEGGRKGGREGGREGERERERERKRTKKKKKKQGEGDTT